MQNNRHVSNQSSDKSTVMTNVFRTEFNKLFESQQYLLTNANNIRDNGVRTEINKLILAQQNFITLLGNFYPELNSVIHDSITSTYLENFLKNSSMILGSSFSDIVREYLGLDVNISTDGGILQGTVLSVDIDFLTIQETLGYETLVPYVHIESITLRGSE